MNNSSTTIVLMTKSMDMYCSNTITMVMMIMNDYNIVTMGTKQQ